MITYFKRRGFAIAPPANEQGFTFQINWFPPFFYLRTKEYRVLIGRGVKKEELGIRRVR